MILIYSDSQIIDLDWLPKISWQDQIEICHEFEQYCRSSATRKIAFTTHRLHCDYDGNCAAYQGFEDKIRKLSACSDLVFSFESELHHYHWNIWDQCHQDNVYWCLPGTVNDQPNIRDHIIPWMDWFKTTSWLYRQLPQDLMEISHVLPKPRSFDALLGSPKPHRDFIYRSVIEHGLSDQFIMPYGGAWRDDEFYAKDYFIWEPGVVPLEDRFAGTAGFVDYHGIRTGLSRVIPKAVFNQTAYSIVAETDHDNTLSFYTEKTAKPLIARRLFVAFSGYQFLANLREHGFMTFGSVIDESYDEIKDDSQRYDLAFQQVVDLCSKDQREVGEIIAPILDHNHDLIMNTDWTTYTARRISAVINR